MKENEYYSAPQAAKTMGISRQRLYAYIKAGKFKTSTLKYGTRWFILGKEIQDFIDGKIDVSGSYVCWRKNK